MEIRGRGNEGVRERKWISLVGVGGWSGERVEREKKRNVW